MKLKSRLQLLTAAVNRWLELPKVSRAIAATAIVEAVDRLHLTEVLANEGITFNRGEDVYNNARVNAQKVFRWLGQYQDCHPNAERLFHVEQAILAAMPMDIRLDYLNNVYSSVGVMVVEDIAPVNGSLQPGKVAAMLTKENSEAQIAVISLGNEPSQQQILDCHRELRESRAVTGLSIRALENQYPFLRQHQLSPIREVGV